MYGFINVTSGDPTANTNLQRWDPHTVGQIRLVGLQQGHEGEQLVFAAVLFLWACRQETGAQRWRYRGDVVRDRNYFF